MGEVVELATPRRALLALAASAGASTRRAAG